MNRRLLDITAAISLLFTVLLAAGFTGSLDASVQHLPNAVAPAGYRSLVLGLDRGRVRAYWTMGVSKVFGPAQPATGFSFDERFRLWPPEPPEIRRLIWEFDAHRLFVSPGSVTWIIACPIWCVMLPFLVAPGIWLRRKLLLKRQTPRGFAVETT